MILDIKKIIHYLINEFIGSVLFFVFTSLAPILHSTLPAPATKGSRVVLADAGGRDGAGMFHRRTSGVGGSGSEGEPDRRHAPRGPTARPKHGAGRRK